MKTFKEKFLHYIWQYQLFDKKELKTTQNEIINVIKQGQSNPNSGPDFLESKIVINHIEWHGNVEIHYKSSEYITHKHIENEAYNSVILHVVWENDQILDKEIPTLELKKRVDKKLITTYESFLSNQDFIPCSNLIHKVPDLNYQLALERALINRIENKAHFVKEIYSQTQNNCEETSYRLLAFTFGLKINSEAFLKLSQYLPLKVLLKHRNQLLSIEALLFGVAGFLNQEIESDIYFQNLKKEYQFLKHKYQLDKEVNLHEWKFLRLRPASFPSVRIAQFANLIYQYPNLFNLLKLNHSTNDFIKNLAINTSEYWQNHYIFGKESKTKVGKLGNMALQNIVINGILPLQFAIADEQENYDNKEKCLLILQILPPEKNQILENWNTLKIKARNAFESQALIELYKNHCSAKKCLQCSVGHYLLNLN